MDLTDPIEPLLERDLCQELEGGLPPRAAVLQIGLAPQAVALLPPGDPDIAPPAAAAWRLHPVTGWRAIPGVDTVQAVDLAIAIAGVETEVSRLRWPQGEAFASLRATHDPLLPDPA